MLLLNKVPNDVVDGLGRSPLDVALTPNIRTLIQKNLNQPTSHFEKIFFSEDIPVTVVYEDEDDDFMSCEEVKEEYKSSDSNDSDKVET